nr:uncharacterized protein LOC4330128 isoform X2 [Oryza sativa Japonica Group]
MASAAAVFPDGRRWCKGGSSSSSPVTTAIFLFFFVVVVGVLVSARWITTTSHLSITNLDEWRTKTVGNPDLHAGHIHPGHPHRAAAAAPGLLHLLLVAASPPRPRRPEEHLPDALPRAILPPSLRPRPRAPATPPYHHQLLLPGLLPLHPRGPPPMASRGRDHPQDARARQGHGQLPPRRAPGPRLRRAHRAGLPDPRPLHHLGHPPAAPPVPRPRPRPRPHVRLRRLARRPSRSVPGGERHRHAAALPVLWRRRDARRRLPGLVLLGPEINIKPWDALQKDLDIGNKRVKWVDREPYAYWKGNPDVATKRKELVKCNVSSKHEWNARIYKQDWIKESKAGYKQSDLASQCTHRYKIYIEGSAWSVSEKYILACNSMTLVVTPKYYDFFSRVLMPTQHYWPVRDDNKCSSIKHAVDWGNSNKKKAQKIGKQASNFIQQELSMDYIYDYMFHLLTEYAKLLRFKPTKPPEAIEICPELLACQAIGRERKFMEDSMVKSANDAGPCDLPPPFSPEEFKELQQRKEKSMKQVETWQQKASQT